MDVRPVWRAALGCPARLPSLRSGFRITPLTLAELRGFEPQTSCMPYPASLRNTVADLTSPAPQDRSSSPIVGLRCGQHCSRPLCDVSPVSASLTTVVRMMGGRPEGRLIAWSSPEGRGSSVRSLLTFCYVSFKDCPPQWNASHAQT